MGVEYELNIFKGSIQMEYQINSRITIFSVLEGQAYLNFEKDKLDLHKGELYVMNFGKLYGIVTKLDTVIATLEINYEDLIKESGKKNLKFFCDTFKKDNPSNYQLKKVFSKLLRLHVAGKNKFEELSSFYTLVSILINEYILNTASEDLNKEDNKIMQARIYLHTHYQEKITLEDVCKKFYFSTSTFTRNFKRQTNKSMIQYLNEIRVQSAKRLLLENEKTVTDVALEVGFSDAASFIKVFKKLNGLSPLKFKQSITTRGNHKLENQELVDIVDNTFLMPEDFFDNGIRKVHKKNDVHIRNFSVYERPWTKAIGVQNAEDLLDFQYQQNLLNLRVELDLRYVRIPYLLSESVVSRRKGYDFSKVDLIFDFLVENQMVPIVELSGRKIEVGTHHLLTTIEEDSEYTYSKEVYEDLVLSFISHVFNRYSGIDEGLSHWIWEFQYERDKYSFNTYSLMFNLFSEAVHKWGKNHLFGGYGIDIYDWNEKDVMAMKDRLVNLDFLSVNVYPYQLMEKKNKKRYLARNIDSNYLRMEMIKLRDVLNKYGFINVPLYATQFNTSLENHNMINDSYIKASRLISMAVRLLGLADLFIYDVAQDERVYDRELYGARGLISYNGLKKPVINALMGLHKLTKQSIICSEDLVFSYLRSNRLFGICSNTKTYNLSYYHKAESDILEEDIESFFDDCDILEQEICITDLANGVYRIRLYVTNEENSTLSHIKRVCKQLELRSEDISFLKKQNLFDLQSMEKVVNDGILSFIVSVKPHEMILIDIIPTQLFD